MSQVIAPNCGDSNAAEGLIVENFDDEPIIPQPPSDPSKINDSVELWVGTPSSDTILANEFARDSIQGLEGDDLIAAMGSQDTVFTGVGNDTAFGGKDDDWLDGGEGDDELHDDRGSDTIFGRQGNDTAFGGRDDD